MKTTLRFAIAAAVLGSLPAVAVAEQDCLKLAVSVKHAIEANPAAVLEVVEARVSANPGCACEVVKAAIEASKADAKLVAAIVETAATAAPDKMRLVAQCAVAVAPDALANVQSVLNRIDPNKGESGHSAKSAKSPKGPIETAPAWNPLDFPGEGPIGPTPGGPPLLPPGLPPGYPPVITPPGDTEIDYGLDSPGEPGPGTEG